uniref:ARAD1C21384p n=1 Tax=Blastobotrys adeninivorans TaxID=409370 RepID=A0A060T7F2_BLAAD
MAPVDLGWDLGPGTSGTVDQWNRTKPIICQTGMRLCFLVAYQPRQEFARHEQLLQGGSVGIRVPQRA